MKMVSIRVHMNDGHNETRYYGGTLHEHVPGRGEVVKPLRKYAIDDAKSIVSRMSTRFSPRVTYTIEK